MTSNRKSLRIKTGRTNTFLLLALLLGLCNRSVVAFLPPTPATAVHQPNNKNNGKPLRQHQQHQHVLRNQQQPLQMSSSSSSKNAALTLYEQFRDRLPSDQVINAVEAQQGGPVVVADIAASAGVPLAQAQRELQLLASLTLADMAVSQDGDLIYRFANKGVRSALAQQNAQYKAQQAFQKAWPTVFWGLRVGFGVALVASLVAIYSTIFFISSSSSSSSDDDRRSNNRGGGGMMGGGGGFNYFWGPSPLDFFYYRPYGMYGYYGSPEYRNTDPEELGLFESVFSYVFGDGNPNAQLEATRLSLAAQMIRQEGGAVTAEQLAPYGDPDITPEQAAKQTYVDESFVLPIVTQLNGEPQVTDDGDIVYVFPELQSTAAKSTSSSTSKSGAKRALLLKRAGLPPNSKAADIQRLLQYNGISTQGVYEQSQLLDLLEQALGSTMSEEEQAQFDQEIAVQDPSLLTEREIPFSVATGFNKLLAGGLGIVNLGGALFLGNQLSQLSGYGIRLPAYYGTVQTLYPFLLGYAVLFNVIPLVRNLWIQRQNAAIQQRNSVRQKWRRAIANSFGTLARKQKAARALRQSVNRLGASPQDIIFDTSQTSMEELERTKQTSEMDEFDKRLKSKAAMDPGDNTDAFQ